MASARSIPQWSKAALARRAVSYSRDIRGGLPSRVESGMSTRVPFDSESATTRRLSAVASPTTA